VTLFIHVIPLGLSYGTWNGLELLDTAGTESLEVGDLVWFEGQIGTPQTPPNDKIAYGCQVEVDPDTFDWDKEVNYFADPVPLRDAEITMTVQLEEGCPNEEGTYYWWESTDSEDRKWKGYKYGHALSIVGRVQSVDPLVVDASRHFGGRAATHIGTLWSDFFPTVLACAASFLVGGWWLLITLTNLGDGWGWTFFARERGLHFYRRHHWTPGMILGLVGVGSGKGRRLNISRRKGIGDHRSMEAEVLLRLWLNPCMAPYEIRKPKTLESLYNRRLSESRIDDPDWSPPYVFTGVDRARWGALLSNRKVRKRLVELDEHDFSLAMKDSVLSVYWKGFETEVMGPVLDHVLELADRMEKAEAATWSQAAEALDLHFAHTPERWELRSRGSMSARSQGPRLVYEKREKQAGWNHSWRSRYQYRVFEPRVSDWLIERLHSQNPGQRTGDPVLDAHLSFRGFEEADLQHLVGLENATPILMAALVAHGMRLEKGELEMSKWGFVADPQGLFEDIAQLEALLSLAVG
jgi:hypothetical protein